MRDRQDSPAGATALAFAAIALGQAIQLRSGTLHPQAMVWLTLSIIACLVSVVSTGVPWMDRFGDRAALWIAIIGITGQLVELLTTRPTDFLQVKGGRAMSPFIAGIVSAAVIAGSGFSRGSRFGRATMPLICLVHLCLGIWIIRNTPEIVMDVDMFQRGGVKAFLNGANPYALTFPDIMNESRLYGPSVSVNGQLTIGFPYPPLSLLMAVPGQLLGDYRYSQLVATTGAGALMAYSRNTRLSMLAAILFLFTPRVFFVLEEGWTEPFVVLMLASVVFVACRAPNFLPLALGLFLAIKQYAFFALPLVVLLLPRPFRWRKYVEVVGIAILIASAITLPFFVLEVRGFWRSVIMFQILQPFRSDALSYVAWFAQGDYHWPQWVAFAGTLVGIVIGIWRTPRTPSGFAAATALTFVGFFAFSKQAFCNYYFFVTGALCIALAASKLSAIEETTREGG